MSGSWEKASSWYEEIVKDEGHFYHKELILPKLRSLVRWKKSDALLDVGCGQGIFAAQIPKEMDYLGVDASKSLIEAAKKRHPKREFLVQNVCGEMQVEREFSHALFLLSLQNMADPCAALKNASGTLQEGGHLILVLNHPCFRIPRQSHWGFDEKQKVQFRRIDCYMSEMAIPIATHPGKKEKKETTSQHFALSTLSKWLFKAGFVVEKMDEWVSPKVSEGGRARTENRARKEFPLFLAIVAKKQRAC